MDGRSHGGMVYMAWSETRVLEEMERIGKATMMSSSSKIEAHLRNGARVSSLALDPRAVNYLL